MNKILSTIFFTLLSFYLYASDIEGKITDTNCGKNDGAIELAINGGLAPYSFTWVGVGGFTSTAQNISGLAAGEYQVEVTDALCGRARLSFTVNSMGFNLKEKVSGTCPSNFGGFIEVTGIDGVAPYFYKWSNGSTDNILAGLKKGTYTITVTDAKKCATVKSYEIKDRIVITPIPMQGCGEKGSISLKADYQTSRGVVYRWEGKNTGFSSLQKDIANLEDDEYRVTVNSDCPDAVISEWIAIKNTALDVSVATTPMSNSAKGTVTFSMTGLDPITYSFDGKPFEKGNSGFYGNLEPGTYSLVVQNGAGCSQTIPVTIFSCDNLDNEYINTSDGFN